MCVCAQSEDIVWLRVVLSLPQSQHIQQEMDALRNRESNGEAEALMIECDIQDGFPCDEAIPRGAYRNLVRAEVGRDQEPTPAPVRLVLAVPIRSDPDSFPNHTLVDH